MLNLSHGSMKRKGRMIQDELRGHMGRWQEREVMNKKIGEACMQTSGEEWQEREAMNKKIGEACQPVEIKEIEKQS